MMKLNVVYPTIKLFFFIQNVFDLTISRIKKELDLHVASDGSIKEDYKVIFCFCCCCTGCVYILIFHQLFYLLFESNNSAVLKQ